MLKFFGKIRKQLLKDGRIGRYLLYAIGEILLVVIGILLALQINNWNEDAKQRVAELTLLQDLKGEFETNHGRFLSLHKEKAERTKEWRIFMDKISDLSLSDEERSAVRPPNGAQAFNASNSVLNSILSSGSIEVIQNDSLKYFLSNWGNEFSEYKEIEGRHKIHVEDNLRSYEAARRQWPNLKSIGLDYDNPFLKNYTKSELQKQSLALNNDYEYQSYLMSNFMWMNLQIQRGDRLDKMFERITGLLQNEIEAKTTE